MAEEKNNKKEVELENETLKSNENKKDTLESEEKSDNDKNDKPKTKKKVSGFGRKKKDSALKKELEQLKEKNEELKDKYIRLVAEYDNYRRRTAKEKIEMREMAVGSVIEDLLSIVDDFERAIDFNESAKDVAQVTEGMNLLYKKLCGFLKSKSVEEIEALNQEFDTDFHEAITKIPAPSEDMKGKVLDVVQKGYRVNDKVIRYSKVVVGE